MALTGDALLENALFSHLGTLTISPSMPFVWPSTNHDGSRPYVTVEHAPNTARASTLSDGEDNPGFLVCTVVFDEGGGTIAAKEVAGQIKAHFQNITLHTTQHRIRFIEPATVGQAVPDGSDLRVPVSISYMATS